MTNIPPNVIKKEKDWLKFIPKSTSKANKYKYCKLIFHKSDPDMLCDNCKSFFGHSLYSEL